MSGPDREPPPTDNVVPIGAGVAARKARAPRPVTALPECTGVAAMSGDPLLDNLRESCLSDDTIGRARLFTLPSAKWRAYGFRSARPQSGLFIPFFAPHAVEPFDYRLRPQYPIPTSKRGRAKTKKYDQRFGGGLLVYTPPLPATVDHLQDIAVPLIWTEGEKKSLLLAQLGQCVVGLTGVDCWIDTEAKARNEGRRLHPYIREHYGIAGRAHVIVFDADTRTNTNIMLAAQKLAGVLVSMGAISVHLCLPPDGGGAKGIDDYAHAHGLDACAHLLATVREPVEDIAPDLGCVPLSHYGAWYEGSGVSHLYMPRGYETERDGSLWHTEDLTRPDERRLVSDAPMVIARQLANMYTGELRSDVRFRDARGVWRSVIVPREVLGDRGLVNALRPYGALVNAGSAAAVTRYLDAFERDNGTLTEQALCVSQTGWHRDQFVAGGAPIMRAPTSQPVQLDGSPELQRIASAVQPARGAELAAHLDALRAPMAGSPECALVVLAALTAPLLRVLDVGNFAVHLCGDSSRGKTSMLRIAASVFGNPRDANWIASWNATVAGLEQRATLLNDLPQCYDEVGAADFELVQRSMYMLINGAGRTRSTRDVTARDTPSWRTVVISTGERELATERDATGAQARVISVPVLGFGELGAADIDAAVRACGQHYGALGRSWLEWLVSRTDDERDGLRAAYEAIAADLRAAAGAANNRLAQRTSAYFAAMALVEAELAAVWGVGREGGATVFELVREWNAEGSDARVKPLAERIVDELRDWIAGYPGSFVDPSTPPEMLPVNARVYGYRFADGQMGFIPSVASDYLASKGLPLTRAVRTELVRMGVMVPDAGDGQSAARHYVAKKRTRLLTFRSCERVL